VMAMFPGACSHTHGGVRFKKGAYQMAFDQHLQIVPITLNGPYKVLPIGSLNVKRHRMEMVIHPPISTAGISPSGKELQKLADYTQEVIASGLWEEFK